MGSFSKAKPRKQKISRKNKAGGLGGEGQGGSKLVLICWGYRTQVS